jgi:hypothetical protein
MHPERQFPRNHGPAKWNLHAEWSDPRNQVNPQNPYETSVSVAGPSGS